MARLVDVVHMCSYSEVLLLVAPRQMNERKGELDTQRSKLSKPIIAGYTLRGCSSRSPCGSSTLAGYYVSSVL